MDKLRRFTRLSLVPMAILLPVWLTFGRSFFGVGGWGMLFYLFYLFPILLLGLFIIGAIVSGRPDVKATGLVSRNDAILLCSLYAIIFLHGLFAVDGGDTEESVKSVATVLLGRGLLGISNALANILFSAGIIAYIATFVVVANERTRAIKQK